MPYGYLDYCPRCGSERGPGGHCCYPGSGEVHAPMNPTDEERREAAEFLARWEEERNHRKGFDDRPEND